MKADKERLLNHIVSMHSEAITALRIAGLEPDQATLKTLTKLHKRIPHPLPLGTEHLA